MKIDDLIGILFLLLFIIGPALKGLIKPAEPLIEVELPPDVGEAAAPNEAGGPQPVAEASPPPPRPQPAAVEKPPRRELTASMRPAAGSAPAAVPMTAAGKPAKAKLGLSTGKKAVLRGMLWHEVLSEPVALRRLKRRRNK